MKYILPLLFLFHLTFVASAQDDDEEQASSKFCNEITNKQALKLYEKGIDKKKYKKPERLDFLRKCLELEPDFAEANLQMGLEIAQHCRVENSSFKPTMLYFYRAIGSCPQIHSEPYYYIGFYWYEEMKNDSAVKYLKKFIDFKDEDENKFSKKFYDGEIYQAREMIKSAKMESELMKKKVPFNPKVVTGVSTPRDEYLAYISPDDKYCFFTRKVSAQGKDKVYETDKEKEVFMVAERDRTGVFNKGDEMPPPFNVTDDNQGGCTITIDNKHLYFAMMKMEGGLQPNCDIYVSNNVNDEWKPIEKLANVNDPKYWDSQPSVSSDGNTIYFSSDRPGGYGKTDIWYTKRDPSTGKWSVPQNAGPKINTPGNERTPFIHSDSETLYFSSDGLYGFGGFDIFYIRKNDKGEWDDPENIGTPINTEGDETGFFVSSDAKTAYFFSFNEGRLANVGIGRYDLYSFELYPEARPQEVALLKGEIKDKNNNVIEGGKVEITNTKTKEKITAVVDSASGQYMAAINVKKTQNADLLVTVKKEGYAFGSQIVSTKDASFNKPPAPVKVEINEANEGSSFVINNLYYNTNSADIKPESFIVLDEFATYLKENPDMKIEIQGHTDNVGNAKANEALSANRAYTVKAYLEEKGVDGKRISAKGFGPNKPIADNSNEDGRAKNRRTEFMIISK